MNAITMTTLQRQNNKRDLYFRIKVTLSIYSTTYSKILSHFGNRTFDES